MTFVLSKVFWAVFNPGNVILFCVAVGALGLLAPWRRLRRAGGVLLGTGLAVALALAVLPAGRWLVDPLEARFPTPVDLSEPVDGIVVLGGSISLGLSSARGRAELTGAADRLTAFVALARRYPKARLVFTGGSGSLRDQVRREADFVEPLLIELGIAPERLLVERDSRNTRENAVNALRLAKPASGETWLLITSAAHMPRAVGCFRTAGWPVVPYPVDYRTDGGPGRLLHIDFAGGLDLATYGVHEWVGLVSYRLFGWTDRLFPRPYGPGASAGRGIPGASAGG
jgi:uncharacterized SAM-binding protein YcdF (DUF218 family)